VKLPEATAKRMDKINKDAHVCPKCQERIVQRYCGRCDLFYTICGCPFVDDGTPYNIDHSKCGGH